MKKHNFYYDESEHSRKININTVNADNYYDNFIAAIVGWKAENEKSVFEKYIAFEEKYAERKSKGELKSQTLKQSQFENGFASMNKDSICFLADLFSIFNEDVSIYFAVVSKIEYIISQVFDGYKNSVFCDMDAMRYSIVKAILMYQPKEIIEGVFENTGELVTILKKFFQDKIDKNKENVPLKDKEIAAFKEILLVLDDIHNIKTIEWNYDIAFWGFERYLKERTIKDFTLTIDKEGENSNTLKAAKRVGFDIVIEADSKESIGVRIADMLAGVIAKLLKSLHNALRYDSFDEQLRKILLRKEWFLLSEEQLGLYKILYKIVCELNNAWHKTFSGKYADDLIAFIALLKYMNRFSTAEEIRKQNIDMQGEYFNKYLCECLEKYFIRMSIKLPIIPISPNEQGYFINPRGAMEFLDANRQPLLKFEKDGTYKCMVLSVGLSNGVIPMANIEEYEKAYCYRLPDDLSDWAMTAVGMAFMGSNLFPAEVEFMQYDGKFSARIL